LGSRAGTGGIAKDRVRKRMTSNLLPHAAAKNLLNERSGMEQRSGFFRSARAVQKATWAVGGEWRVRGGFWALIQK